MRFFVENLENMEPAAQSLRERARWPKKAPKGKKSHPFLEGLLECFRDMLGDAKMREKRCLKKAAEGCPRRTPEEAKCGENATKMKPGGSTRKCVEKVSNLKGREP